MANSKELTEQVMELHKKQTEEMEALSRLRSTMKPLSSFTICMTATLRLVSPRNRHGS